MAKKKDEITIRSSAAEYLTYVASVGDQQDSIEMHYEDENIWLTQRMMATLYDVGLPTINEHIKKIYADSELEESATIRNFRIVQTEGSRQVTHDTKHYIAAKNLATEMTNYNVEEKDLQGETTITVEHVENNTSVRDMLGQRGIKSENLPASEDIKN